MHKPNVGTVDYLVGGLRISVGDASTTPGPSSHIENFVGALEQRGIRVRLFLVSRLPGLTRFAKLPEGAAKRASRFQVFIGDVVRLLSSGWSGVVLWSTSLRGRPSMIYERAAVMQSLYRFHPARRRSVVVVESNGIMSRETARDRSALVLERLARRIEIATYRDADIVVAVSSALASEIHRFAEVPEDRILVVPNGISSSVLDHPVERDNDFVIGFSGSVVPWQNVGLLLEAANIAVSELGIDDLRVQIVGAGPAVESLRAQVEELQLVDRVQFLGRMTRSSAYLHMSRWSVGYSGHIATSSQDMYHSPLKVYEYAGMGLSCLSTRSDDGLALRRSGARVEFFSDLESLVHGIATLHETRESDCRTLESRRASVAAEHSWTARAEAVLQSVARLEAA